VSEKAVAIITARGGSKRIPRKNIKEFLGAPIISYPISAALDSSVFDEVMVSTDDAEIADVAIRRGAKVPFFRSPATSHDLAMTAEVVVEVLHEYSTRGRDFAFACCIYPTAPFVTAHMLAKGYEALRAHNMDSVIPVVRFGYPIQRAMRIVEGRLEMIWPENLNMRSQDLPAAFHDAGQFYWLNVEAFVDQKKLFMRNTAALEIPESETQDIDNEEDWKIAEIKYSILRNRSGLGSADFR
jgi:N-acylneuraminate cytidylyltransferase